MAHEESRRQRALRVLSDAFGDSGSDSDDGHAKAQPNGNGPHRPVSHGAPRTGDVYDESGCIWTLRAGSVDDAPTPIYGTGHMSHCSV